MQEEEGEEEDDKKTDPPFSLEVRLRVVGG